MDKKSNNFKPQILINIYNIILWKPAHMETVVQIHQYCLFMFNYRKLVNLLGL